MNNRSKMTVSLILIVALSLLGVVEGCHSGDTSSTKVQYQSISEFSPEVNSAFKSFLVKSQSEKERKVAVFDCDGTLIGQVPHYLADEALFEYAKSRYKGKDDSVSRAKMNIVNQMVHGDNVGDEYITDRIHFFAGMPADSLEHWGTKVYKTHYSAKFYPGMKGVVNNLRNFGFEIWIITASPEFLYQQFVAEELGIPENRIIGVKSIIRDGIVSDQIVHPIPQDEGKTYTTSTFIETTPLFVAGNSMGDVAMIKQSKGMKWIVNPNGENKQGSLGGVTLQAFAKNNGWTAVYCPDPSDSSLSYTSDDSSIPKNKMIIHKN